MCCFDLVAYLRFFVSIFVLFFAHLVQAKTLKVLATIEPLSLIAQELLGTDVEVDSILAAGVSPHQYALKPSDALAINQADIILWVGPGLETFMQKSLAQAKAVVIQLDESVGLNWPADKHQHGQDWSRDFHIWLDPRNAEVIAKQVFQALPKSLIPENGDQRLVQFLQQLNHFQQRWQKQLEPYKERPLMVYHNGYQHLAAGLGINIQAWVSRGDGHSLSIKKRWQLERQMASMKPPCLLAEPYGEQRQAKRFADNAKLPLIFLDPLAGSQPYDLYSQWMDSQVSQVLVCYQVGVGL